MKHNGPPRVRLPPSRPIVIYDRDCGFCRRSVARWQARTGDRVRYLPFQLPGLLARFAIPRADARRSVQLVLPDGRRFEGAAAVFRALGTPAARLGRLPLVLPIAERIYRWIARHRTLAARIDRLLLGAEAAPPSTSRVARWFLAGLGSIYFISFRSLRGQALGLWGRRGILPAAELLEQARSVLGRERYHLLPTLFWLDASDGALLRACRLGEAASVALVLGVRPSAMAALLWALYLSLVTVGQDFLAFQWDALLLESGLLALLVAPARGWPPVEPPRVGVAMFRWLALRLQLESGLAKLGSHDPTWRDLTACCYHYATQPLPTRLGWAAHHLPRWLQRVSTAMALGVELGTPLLTLAPRRPRRIAFAAVTALQAAIAATGNYGFFNLLTVVDSLWLLDDAALPRVRGALSSRRRRPRPPSKAWRLASALAALPLAILSGASLLGRLLGRPVGGAPITGLVQATAPLRSVNSYGLFAVMTTDRPEIEIEGSLDGRTWRAYGFRFKPGDPRRPPRTVAPHQPRLDWQMWFAALSPVPPWFLLLLERLLQGSPEVIGLFEENPFPDGPPRWVRAQLYRYRMTDRETRRRTGAWWSRELLGPYVQPCSIAPGAELR